MQAIKMARSFVEVNTPQTTDPGTSKNTKQNKTPTKQPISQQQTHT